MSVSLEPVCAHSGGYLQGHGAGIVGLFHQFGHKDDVNAFRNSPMIQHIAGTGRCSVDDLVAQAAQLYLDSANDALKFDSGSAFHYMICAADFGLPDALKIAADAFEKGFLAVNGGENIPVAKNVGRALEYWKKLSVVTPDNLYPDYRCGQILLYTDSEEKNPEAAVSYFDKVIERSDKKGFLVSAAYKNRAQCYLVMGDTVALFNKHKEAFEAGCNSGAHNLGNW